jgi:hypothetical protein
MKMNIVRYYMWPIGSEYWHVLHTVTAMWPILCPNQSGLKVQNWHKNNCPLNFELTCMHENKIPEQIKSFGRDDAESINHLKLN